MIEVQVVNMGNDKVVIIPEEILAQCKITDYVEITVKNKNILLSSVPKKRKRPS